MKKRLLVAVLMIFVLSSSILVHCDTLDDAVIDVMTVAKTYEKNLVRYAEIGLWQYNDIPLSIPEGESENLRVQPDDPLGMDSSAEIDYFWSLDETLLYQVYNSGNAIYVVEYRLNGHIDVVNSWRFK